ncbi:TIGR02450 family Trp-rich protein [Psychrosphaera aquimarina]|uniref:TIGR02450 family Trp-rich protein n=1 Tax=Psychrosphaera aquimarina TaxID=2044854 RepID=A0ABU3QYH3_9GAMM|nr:TIGR02450 family Trp-rich protein [Psychrosphaera aquimarina]MDU0112473.1 TIGR02450 family Trp-rich protein [Psychrosphaera aquimarina]
MNKVSPKTLLNSKWTKCKISNKEKHFIIVDVEFNDEQLLTKCVIEAVFNNNQYEIDWKTLKDPNLWKIGWQ